MTYRAITVAHLEPVTPATQTAPMLSWLPLAEMMIDERYQRPLGPANWAAIRAIADNFQWGRFAPVLVSPLEGGGFAVIDGQHRVHAAALCGFDKVPAMAVLMPVADQAAAFTWVNGQVIRLSPLQMYRAALVAGQDWAVQVDACVSAAGCRMMRGNASGGNRQAGQVFCIGLIRKAVAGGGARGVTAALAALRAYDVQGRPALWSDYILSPWVMAVTSDARFAEADLGAVLALRDPFKVVDRAGLVDGPGSRQAKAARLFAAMIGAQMRGAAA
jgi:ParB-like nuclease domain